MPPAAITTSSASRGSRASWRAEGVGLTPISLQRHLKIVARVTAPSCPAWQVLNPQRQTNFSSSSSQAKDAFKVSVTLSEMVSKARESLITVVQSYTTSQCPELTPPAKDLHAFISQVTNQVIKSCAWQNTGKERARYQKSPQGHGPCLSSPGGGLPKSDACSGLRQKGDDLKKNVSILHKLI